MAAELIGWHTLKWSGGEFEICLRPGGKFFCNKFQESAKWEFSGGTVKIDWGRYGKYEMTVTEGKNMKGNSVPKDENDETNWRTSVFARPLSAVETLLFGDGAGTEWDFQHSGGSFYVEFKCDGYNHFKCSQFPAHSHWSLDGNKLFINWGQYGKYDLVIDPETKTMEGLMVGGKPESDWRKAKFERNLIDAGSTEVCEHHH